MTSLIANKSFLENFNTDGIESDNPLEKIKQNKQKSDEKKKTFKKFLIWGLASHLVHFIFFSQALPPKKVIRNKQVIPNNFGHISLPAVLATELKEETIKIKILDKSFKRKIAVGYMKRSENSHKIQNSYDSSAKKINFYIPYSKFEDVLVAAEEGITIVPFEVKSKKRKKHEITF